MTATVRKPERTRSRTWSIVSRHPYSKIVETLDAQLQSNARIPQAIQYLSGKLSTLESVTEPRLEASILMSVALNEPRDALITNYNRILTEVERQRLENVLLERLKEKPVPYISGVKEFYGRSFFVSKDTLIPRPATETLVSESLNAIQAYFQDRPFVPLSGSSNSSPVEISPLNLLELGVGSGCVIMSMISELNPSSSSFSAPSSSNNVSPSATSPSSSLPHVFSRKWLGTGVDKSKGALTVSERNARFHHVDHLIQFYESDWLEDLVGRHGVRTKWDVVVSNPPYLTKWDWDTAPKIMRDFEPSTAFLGGDDGLDCYRDIHRQLPHVLEPGALVCLEIGAWQEESVVDIFKPDFSLLRKAKDMDGYMRVLIFKFAGQHLKAKEVM